MQSTHVRVLFFVVNIGLTYALSAEHQTLILHTILSSAEQQTTSE